MKGEYMKHNHKFECADECNPMPLPAYQDPEGWLERQIQRLPLGYRLVVTIALISLAVWILAQFC